MQCRCSSRKASSGPACGTRPTPPASSYLLTGCTSPHATGRRVQYEHVRAPVTAYCCSCVTLLFSVPDWLLCLICKFHFPTGVYVQEKYRTQSFLVPSQVSGIHWESWESILCGREGNYPLFKKRDLEKSLKGSLAPNHLKMIISRQ